MTVLYVHYSHFQFAHACFDSLSWGAPQPHCSFSTGSGGSSATRSFRGVVENCHPHNVDLEVESPNLTPRQTQTPLDALSATGRQEPAPESGHFLQYDVSLAVIHVLR